MIDPEWDGTADTLARFNLGTTKREEFAKVAMQGILAGRDVVNGCPTKQAAIDSVRYADALLAALEEKS